MGPALEFALNCDRPVAIRYPKDIVRPKLLGDAANEICSSAFELGKSVTVKSSSESEVAIVSYGSMLSEAVAAAEQLAAEGVEVDVINARFADPVDEEIISLLGKGKGIITVEDHSRACGFGSGVLEAASAVFGKQSRGPIKVLGVPDRFIKVNSRKAQLAEAGLNADKIVEAVKEMLSVNA